MKELGVIVFVNTIKVFRQWIVCQVYCVKYTYDCKLICRATKTQAIILNILFSYAIDLLKKTTD